MSNTTVIRILLFISTFYIIHGHSQSEGYFSKHVTTGNVSQVFEGNLTGKVVKLLHCSERCVLTPSCNSFFYRKFHKDCVLHANILVIAEQQSGEWQYWYRRIPYKVSSPCDEKKERNRLLVLASILTTYSEHFRQLHLRNKSIEYYNKLYVHISAVFYSSTLNRIIIASTKRKTLFLFPVDSSRGVKFLTNIDCHGIAEDKGQFFLFFSTHSSLQRSQTYVKKMKVAGSKQETILSFKENDIAGSLATDCKRLILFVSLKSKIISVNYFGKNRNILVDGPNVMVTSMTYDNDNNALYYNQYKDILKLDLFRNFTSKWATISFNVHNMVYHSNTLYISPFGLANGIGVITNGIVSMVKNKYNSFPPYVVIALIP